MSKQLFVDPVELRKSGKITFEDIPVNQYNKTIADEKANYTKADFVRIFNDIAMLREFESMINSIKIVKKLLRFLPSRGRNERESSLHGGTLCRARPGKSLLLANEHKS